MLYQELKTKNLLNFILAGDATLTIVSKSSNNHITLTIKKAKKGTRYNVRHIGTVIGFLDDMAFHFDPPVVEPSQPQKIMAFIWKYILLPDHLAKFVTLYHHGNCGRCGRKLTDPDSMSIGLGPDCLKLTLKNQ